MASEQVVVQVRRGGTVAEDAIRRPVRITPDGYAGVVYEGAVYPLLAGNTIDADGASCEPEDAKRFLIAGAPIPYSPARIIASPPEFRGFDGEWYVETTRFGHYVLFDAPERVAVTVVEALEHGGLSVQRWDVSHRVADNARHYDWFARLRLHGEHDEVASLVEAIFAAPDVPNSLPVVAPEIDRVAHLLDRVEDLVGQLVAMQTRLATSDAEMAALRGRLDSESGRAERLGDMLAKSMLHQQTLAEALSSAQLGTTSGAGGDAVEMARREAEELLEFALAENAELEHQVNDLTARSHGDAERIRSLDESLAHTSELLSELGAEERRSSRTVSPTIPPRGVIAFVEAAFPRLEFVLDSLETIELFEAPQSLMRALVQIDSGEVVGKDLEGVLRWREVSKIATGIPGSESLGRIYYQPGGQRVLVCVHLKQDEKEQERLIRRIARL